MKRYTLKLSSQVFFFTCRFAIFRFAPSIYLHPKRKEWVDARHCYCQIYHFLCAALVYVYYVLMNCHAVCSDIFWRWWTINLWDGRNGRFVVCTVRDAWGRGGLGQEFECLDGWQQPRLMVPHQRRSLPQDMSRKMTREWMKHITLLLLHSFIQIVVSIALRSCYASMAQNENPSNV